MAATTPTPCERCGTPTAEIGLLKGDARVIMHSCSRCDHRTWTKDGRPTAMSEILAAVATTGRRRSA